MADDEARARRTGKATGGAGVRKAPAKKAGPGTTAPVRKAAAGKAATTKAPAVKKAPAARGRAKKAADAEAPSTPASAKKATAAKKAPKAAATKRPAGRKAGALPAGQEKKARPMKLAAEQTFDDDWEAPEPEPVREDPAARMRAILRAAAASLEKRDEAPPAPPAPTAAPETGTRVIVPRAPTAPAAVGQPELEADPEVEEDWSPPEVLEEAAAAPPPPPPPPSPPPPPPPPASAPPAAATAPADYTPPSPPPTQEIIAPRPPSPPKEEQEKAGAGLSIVAIVLALVVPLVGAIVGFLLANRGRQRGAALAGVARVVSVLAFVAWLVGAGVGAFVAFGDQGVDYSKLKVGDCFDSSPTNEVRGVKVKDCSEPHNSEIFFIVTHPAGPNDAYPGKDTLVQYAADACLGQPLTEYLGIPLEQSSLKDFEIVPQESAWEDGRRVLVCGIDTGGEGRITGSVKGTRR